MTIEIIESELVIDEENFSFWSCWLEISQVSEVYLLPATAPGELLEVSLQAHFEANEAQLFGLAQTRGLDIDQVYSRLPRHALRAALLLILDEINILRGLHGLPARSSVQARTAFKNKLKSF